MRKDEPVRGAGFFRRLAAHVLVDLPLVTVILIPVLLVLMLQLYGLERMLVPGAVQPPWWWNVILNAALLVTLVALWKTTQATPGKKAFGLKIVDGRTGQAAATWRLWVRSIGYLVASLPLVPVRVDMMGMKETLWVPLGLGFWWILIDRRHRGWHDLLSGTVTVVARRDAGQGAPGEENQGKSGLIRKEPEAGAANAVAEMVDRKLN